MSKLFIYPLLLVSIVISVISCGGDSGDVQVVPAANTVPVADAGADKNIMTGVLTTLDGSGSTDADLDPLSYQWAFVSMPSSSQTTLVLETTVNPSFTPDVGGDYTVSLVVNDGTDDSSADTVTLTASATANNPPLADAGVDRNVTTTLPVSLDGSGSSDLDGDPLTYLWAFDSIPFNSATMLFSATTQTPSFTPDVDGGYTISLVVNDGIVDSVADMVTITASAVAVNSAPVADAGPDISVDTGDMVVLDGNDSSDLDGDTLTYLWSFTSKPSGSVAVLVSQTMATPSFTADKDGIYTVSLTVNDGTVDSVPDSVLVTAATAPSASFLAGRDKYDVDCAACHAAGSYDPVGTRSDLYGDGDLVVPDLNAAYGGMKLVDYLSAQEVLDLKAFLDDPSIQ